MRGLHARLIRSMGRGIHMNLRIAPLMRAFGFACCTAFMLIPPMAQAAPPPPPETGRGGPAQVDRIVIQTDLWVLIPDAPFKSTFIIARHGQRFDLQGMAYDGREAHLYSETVPPAAVEQLAAAVQAPLQPGFTFASLGSHAQSALESIQESIREDSQDANIIPSERALLARLAGNRAQIEAAISKSSPITHTDDYGSLAIAVEWSNGKEVAAKAGAQHLYLLPWSIKDRGKTFNPAIALAVHDLLPKQSNYRRRLEFDSWTERSLMEMFDSGMSLQFSALQAEDASASAVEVLHAAFDVREIGIAGYLRDLSFAKGAPKDLVATLKLPGTPKNLDMQFRATIDHGKALNLDREIARAKYMFKLVAENPTLATQMAVNIGNHFTIRYWYGTSLHPDELGMYGDELGDFARLMRKKNGITLTSPQLADAALVSEVGKPPDREWVILPDGHAVLWHEMSPHSDDLSERAKSCAVGEDKMPIYSCVGRMFDPNGEVIR